MLEYEEVAFTYDLKTLIGEARDHRTLSYSNSCRRIATIRASRYPGIGRRYFLSSARLLSGLSTGIERQPHRGERSRLDNARVSHLSLALE